MCVWGENIGCECVHCLHQFALLISKQLAVTLAIDCQYDWHIAGYRECVTTVRGGCAIKGATDDTGKQCFVQYAQGSVAHLHNLRGAVIDNDISISLPCCNQRSD